MKRLFIGLLLLVLSVTVWANCLGFDYEIELAWLPTGSSYELVEGPGGVYVNGDIYYVSAEVFEWYIDKDMFVIALSTRVWLWDTIFVGGKIGILMNMIAWNSFDPWWTEYMFEAGLQFGILEIFYEHICSHPQSTYPVFFRAIGIRGEGAHDKLGVRIKGSTR